MKYDEITNQIRFVKELTSRLPDSGKDCDGFVSIGAYGYKKYSKHRVITDIQRIRRELLELEKMIKEDIL